VQRVSGGGVPFPVDAGLIEAAGDSSALGCSYGAENREREDLRLNLQVICIALYGKPNRPESYYGSTYSNTFDRLGFTFYRYRISGII